MPAGETRPAPPVSILLVDDRQDHLLVLDAILQDLGHSLVCARSGIEALDLLAAQDFAVVLLDVRMHGLDGFETARRLRTLERSQHTPIIFLSAHDECRARVEEAYALGAVDYLLKPLVPVILRAKVAVFVELYRKTALIAQQAEALRAAQRETEQRFSRFMQHLTGLAWIKDLGGRYVYANDAALRAFRTSPERIFGNTDADIFPAATAAQFLENDRRALASPAGIQILETLQHDDGVVHTSLVSKFPIPGPDGTPSLIGGMAFDITDRIEMEARLKEADRRKDEFLAMLAHELRNPLAPIRNALYILHLPATAGADTEQALTIVERQVHTMVRLVDDLLDVNRITRGKIELRMAPIDLALIIQRAVESARPLIEANRHTLTVTLLAAPARVYADATRLEQVFANLLNNAAKYTERGGSIRVTMEHRTGFAVVRVADSGFGIPAQVLPHIFDLFAQGERTLDRAQGGLGIGLTLVKTLLEMHHGTVSALSDGPGKGSEFVVQLPAMLEASAALTPTNGPNAEWPHAALQVLVVEDHKDSADSLAMLLTLWGHDVRTAHDGRSGLKAAQSYRPHIVFLDIGLPGLDGYEVARRLRGEFGQQMRLVALTGYGQDDDRRRAQAAGFDAHLVKPADPDVLQHLLAGR
jgi:PAS domain S-box-containing protein